MSLYCGFRNTIASNMIALKKWLHKGFNLVNLKSEMCLDKLQNTNKF